MGILVAAALKVLYTYHQTKGKSPGQLVFGQDTILPINHMANWIYIRQLKQAQIEKYIIRENSTIIEYNFRVGDQITLRKKSGYKYETRFKVPYEHFQTWTNGSATLHTRAVTTRVKKIPY